MDVIATQHFMESARISVFLKPPTAPHVTMEDDEG